MRRAPLPLIATVVTLLVTLGGCGGSSTEIGDLPADAVFLSAVDASTDISTVRVKYEGTTLRDGEVFHTGGGEAVFAPGAVSFTFTMGDWAGMGGSGDGDGAGEVSYELRFVDGTMYMRVPEMPPGMAGEDPPDAEWIVYSGDDANEMAVQLDQLDFGATLQALRDSAEVTEDGRETIAGVETTRYVGTTTLRSLMLAQGMTEEQLEEQELQQQEFEDQEFEDQEVGTVGPDLDEPMPLTVWIGDDGLVRRYDYTTVTGELETTQSMTVLEYGLEVDITAPPAELTMDASEFESSFQSSAGSYGSEFEEFEEFEMEGSEGMVELESEGSITVEAEDSATAESVPAPQASPDSDG